MKILGPKKYRCRQLVYSQTTVWEAVGNEQQHIFFAHADSWSALINLSNIFLSGVLGR